MISLQVRRPTAMILFAMAICLFFSCMPPAHANPAEQWVESQAGQLDTDEIEQYWENLLEQYGGFFPENKPPGFMEMLVPGGEGLSFRQAMLGLVCFLFHELMYNGRLMVTIVMIAIFSMLLETLQSAFERQAVSKVAYTVSFIVLLIIAVNSFHSAIGYARGAIESMIHFMVAMVPLLLTLLASMGNVITVSVMHPLIIFMIHTVGTLIYTFVFPLIFFSAVLYIVSSLSENYKLTQLARLLRFVGIGTLGVFLTVFLGVVSVQGVSAAAMDGVTIKTAKYVTGNFVPVVGKILSDATDTIISASLLVKNAVGLAGVIVLLMLCAFPALKILAMAAIYNIAAAIMQPLGNSPIVECLHTIGKSMIYVFAALACVGLMFFLAITIIIAAGNVSIMMR